MKMPGHAAGVRLSLDLDDPEPVPYFLWDDPMTVSELRARLHGASGERLRLLGRILREARDTDVWRFTTPAEVAASWPALERHLGVDATSGGSCSGAGRSLGSMTHARSRLTRFQASLTEALAAGQRKDGGLTPAQLAWVLPQTTIGDDAALPGEVPPAEPRAYLGGLIDRLVRLANP